MDLNLFITRQRMFTTAILGLLSRNQVFYVSKMTQLVAYDHEKDEDSDGSESDKEKGKKTNRSIFSDRIAKDLINSHDKVDHRLLKMHKITTGPTQKIDKMGYLGVKDHLNKSLTSKFANSESDLVKKDEKHGDKPILLQNFFSKLRNSEPP